MIVKYDATIAAATLRSGAPGVERVIIARTDGTIFFDDGGDKPDEAAQVAATLMKVASRGMEWFLLGAPSSMTVRSADGAIVLWPVDDLHVLAVVGSADVNLALLDRVGVRVVETLTKGQGTSAKHKAPAS